MKTYRLNENPVDRFWKKVNISSQDECWEWIGGISPNGYGKFRIRKKNWLPHRFSYSISIGDIPSGMVICHKCDNRRCVNPNHLFVGTRQDNENDKVKKGRQAKGYKNGQAGRKNWTNILSELDVLQIRASNDSGSLLSKKYKVSQQTICDIRHNRSWGWL